MLDLFGMKWQAETLPTSALQSCSSPFCTPKAGSLCTGTPLLSRQSILALRCPYFVWISLTSNQDVPHSITTGKLWHTRLFYQFSEAQAFVACGVRKGCPWEEGEPSIPPTAWQGDAGNPASPCSPSTTERRKHFWRINQNSGSLSGKHKLGFLITKDSSLWLRALGHSYLKPQLEVHLQYRNTIKSKPQCNSLITYCLPWSCETEPTSLEEQSSAKGDP